MKKYRVQGPDGRVHVIEGPDDATPEQVVSFAQQQFKAMPAAENKFETGAIEDYARGTVGSFLNTATFGLADKVGGLGRMAGQAVKDYLTGEDSDLSAAYHLPQKDRLHFAEENPKTAFVSGLAGAIANPANRALGHWAVSGKGMGSLIGRGAQAGALIGGAQALGETQTPFTQGEGVYENMGRGAQNALANAAKHGIISGAIGAVLPPVISGASGAAKNVWRAGVDRLPYKQGTVALRKTAEALHRDKVTPAQAVRKIREMGDDAALMDVGPNSRALAQTVYGRPGPGKKTIEKFLTARQEGSRDASGNLIGGQAQRVSGEIENLVPGNFNARKDAVDLARKAYGTQYEAAKTGASAVDIKPLLENLTNEIKTSKGSIKAGLQRVKKLLVDANGAPETSVESLHQAKMAIDDLMSGNVASSIGRVAKGRIRDYQNQLVSAIEDAGEAGAAYRAGRLGTAGQWRLDEALEGGRNFMTRSNFKDSESLQAALKKMSAEELDHFRIGAARALKDRIGESVARADVTKKIMDIPALENKIKIAFGDKELFKRYIQRLQGEKEMFKSYSDVLKGSQTAERMAAMEDAGIDPGALIQMGVSAKTGNMPGVIQSLLNQISGLRNRYTIPEGTSRELGGLLTSRGHEGLNKTFREVLNRDMRNKGLLEALIIGESSAAPQMFLDRRK